MSDSSEGCYLSGLPRSPLGFVAWQAQCLSAGFLPAPRQPAVSSPGPLIWGEGQGCVWVTNAEFVYNFTKGSVMAYLTASNGWKGLIVAIAVYEVVCAEEELLSRGFDRLLVKHPVWPRVFVVLLSAHLANLIPTKYDLVSFVFNAIRGLRWKIGFR